MPRANSGRQRERGILRLSVEAAERVHLQGYVVYCVVAVCADGVRRRWRRYSQFLQLKEGLSSADAKSVTSEFPKKKWRQTLSFGAIERRRVRLHTFVSSLLENPLAFKSRGALRTFLALEPPTPPPGPPPSPPSALKELVAAAKKAFGVGGGEAEAGAAAHGMLRSGGQHSFGSAADCGCGVAPPRARRPSSRPSSSLGLGGGGGLPSGRPASAGTGAADCGRWSAGQLPDGSAWDMSAVGIGGGSEWSSARRLAAGRRGNCDEGSDDHRASCDKLDSGAREGGRASGLHVASSFLSPKGSSRRCASMMDMAGSVTGQGGNAGYGHRGTASAGRQERARRRARRRRKKKQASTPLGAMAQSGGLLCDELEVTAAERAVSTSRRELSEQLRAGLISKDEYLVLEAVEARNAEILRKKRVLVARSCGGGGGSSKGSRSGRSKAHGAGGEAMLLLEGGGESSNAGAANAGAASQRRSTLSLAARRGAQSRSCSPLSPPSSRGCSPAPEPTPESSKGAPPPTIVSSVAPRAGASLRPGSGCSAGGRGEQLSTTSMCSFGESESELEGFDSAFETDASESDWVAGGGGADDDDVCECAEDEDDSAPLHLHCSGGLMWPLQVTPLLPPCAPAELDQVPAALLAAPTAQRAYTL